MSRHLADKRTPSTGGRLRAFMTIARSDRSGADGRPWHRPHHDRTGQDETSPSRLQQFLRIARGRLR